MYIINFIVTLWDLPSQPLRERNTPKAAVNRREKIETDSFLTEYWIFI